MLRTSVTERFGLATPILSAGMAMVARPALAAAVSNAGGLGMLGTDVLPPAALGEMMRATRALTERPFGVDLLGPFLTDAHIDVAIAEGAALVVAFWGGPSPAQVERLKAAGVAFWMQVGSVAEAREAAALGAETVIVQGAEGGGHNRAEAATMTLLPAVRRAIAPLPVVAAGGIVCGRTMAAALALGAEAVWCGTRFLASAEADAHPGYKQAVLDAGVGDTLKTTLFGPEWPDAPMRVLANAATREWAGREAEARVRYGEETVATLATPEGAVPLPRFSVYLPTTAVAGDLDQLCLTAGESAGNVAQILPAAAIVEAMTRECRDVLTGLAAAHLQPAA
jgi:NAD(P)H-dependent flavin oxidoreductase YrpB (nitropropane dioxygenase family)